VDSVVRWARSKDGRLVLSCAGIDPTERAVQGLAEFVKRGERVSSALRLSDGEDELAEAA
jgi:hypothetical protein